MPTVGSLVPCTKGGWMISPPQHCPNGHSLGPGRVLVGHQPCAGGCHGGHTRGNACRATRLPMRRVWVLAVGCSTLLRSNADHSGIERQPTSVCTPRADGVGVDRYGDFIIADVNKRGSVSGRPTPCAGRPPALVPWRLSARRRGPPRRAVDRALDLGPLPQFPTRRWYKGNY
jgi:hypothetical protein